MKTIHTMLKREDRAVDALFFAFRAVLVIVGVVGWYVGDKFWIYL